VSGVNPPLDVRTRPGLEQRSASRVADALAAVRAEDLVAELRALLAVPSVTGSAAESEAQHHVERRLRAIGMDTDLWGIDVAATAADPQFPGMEADRDEAWGLVGACGDGQRSTRSSEAATQSADGKSSIRLLLHSRRRPDAATGTGAVKGTGALWWSSCHVRAAQIARRSSSRHWWTSAGKSAAAPESIQRS